MKSAPNAPLHHPILADLPSLVFRASLSEVNAEPKIGNVGPTQDFARTTYQDFVCSIQSLKEQTELYVKTLDRHYQDKSLDEIDFSSYGIGDFYQNAVEAMMQSQSGGNTILGHILLYGPLITTTYFLYSHFSSGQQNFWELNDFLLNQTTSTDCIKLYKALRMANPGGLGKSDRLDVNNDRSFEEFQRKPYNFPEIFAINQGHDFVGEQLAQNYAFIRTYCLPELLEARTQYSSLDEAIVVLFLKILATKGDSLIIRKRGRQMGALIQQRAHKIIEQNPFSSEWKKAMTQLNVFLQDCKNSLNPGSTADLVACTLLCFFLLHKE